MDFYIKLELSEETQRGRSLDQGQYLHATTNTTTTATFTVVTASTTAAATKLL